LIRRVGRAALLNVDRRRRRRHGKRRIIGKRGEIPESWRGYDNAEAYARSAEVMAAALTTADVAAARVPLANATVSECGGARCRDQQHHQQGQDASQSPNPDWQSKPGRVRSHDCKISAAGESLVAVAEAIRVAAAEASPVVVPVVYTARPGSDSNS
jgi:hypothetical protein